MQLLGCISLQVGLPERKKRKKSLHIRGEPANLLVGITPCCAGSYFLRYSALVRLRYNFTSLRTDVQHLQHKILLTSLIFEVIVFLQSSVSIVR